MAIGVDHHLSLLHVSVAVAAYSLVVPGLVVGGMDAFPNLFYANSKSVLEIMLQLFHVHFVHLSPLRIQIMLKLGHLLLHVFALFFWSSIDGLLSPLSSTAG